MSHGLVVGVRSIAVLASREAARDLGVARNAESKNLALFDASRCATPVAQYSSSLGLSRFCALSFRRRCASRRATAA
jgi:hypothetical protein